MGQSNRVSEVVKSRFVGTHDVLGVPIPDAYVDSFIQQIEKSVKL